MDTLNKKRFFIVVVLILFVCVVIYTSLIFLAKRAYTAGNYLRAESYYSILVRLNPFARMAYARLGSIELFKNQPVIDLLRTTLTAKDLPSNLDNPFFESGKYSERAIKLGLRESWVYYNAGAAYDNFWLIQSRKNPGSADPSQAIFYYKKALEIDPENIQAHNSLGSIYYQKEQYDLAISHFRKVLDKDKDDGRIYALIGFSYAELGDFAIAIPYLDVTIRLNYKNYPFPYFVHWYKGWCYLELGELGKALTEFNKAIALDPNNARQAYFRRGSIYFTRGGRDNLIKAKEDFETYLRIYPEGPSVERVRALLKEIEGKM